MWSVLRFAARAALWRTTADPPLVGLPVLVGWTIVLALVRIGIQYLDAAPPRVFMPYGLNALVAWLAIMLAVAALFVRPAARTTALAAMIALSVVVEVALTAIRLAGGLLPATPPSAAISYFPFLQAPWFAQLVELAVVISIFAAPAVSWIGGVFAIVRSVEPAPRWPLFGRVIALWAALFVAKALVPYVPVFAGADFDQSTANWWEFARTRYQERTQSSPSVPSAEARADEPTSEGASAEDRQARLLRAAVAKLTAQQAGTSDVYAIGVAGWADLDVFIKEIDGAFASIGQILPIKDRIVRLFNNRETVEATPLASRRNFAAAVRAVGKLMDKNEDVLLLVMSSHGTTEGFSLQLPAGGSQVLSPHEVRRVLEEAGIKNRIVIVSACYSGAFVAPLADDNTIVLTAADALSTSFGCAAGRDWTYFGDAFFHQALKPGTDFKQAFDHARILIRGWEALDHLPPSNPQAHFGPALTARLEPLLKAMTGQ